MAMNIKQEEINILDSRVFANATHKNDSQMSESGRSMVEMIGTLAIIGVLSIGGIAGYSYGMDKYRANTIMNDVMLRSVDVIAQFDRTGDANLDSWPTTTAGGYTIGLENETIGIQVDNVPERICEMVFDGMINQATVKIGATEHDAPTDDDVCGDTNTMVFYVDDGVNLGAGGQPGDNEPNLCDTVTCRECTACNPDSGRCEPANENLSCGDGGVCESGECVGDGEIAVMAACSEDADCGGECYACSGICIFGEKHGQACADGAGVCSYYGQCLVGACTSNSDCTGQDQYCADTNDSCTVAHPSKCTTFNYMTRKLTVNGTTQTVLISKDWLTWWDADAACRAKGKSLLSVNDLVSGWDGSSTGFHTPTALLEALASELGDYYYIWTKDLTSTSGDCYAFDVGTDGDVTNFQRYYSIILAVCR